VLARLWKKAEVRAEARPLAAARSAGPNPGPVLVSSTVAPAAVPDRGLPLESLSEAPKLCRKRVRIGRLYPETKPKALVHARALMRLIQRECPELIGAYVPDHDLDRSYEELCASEGWPRCNWVAIARQLKVMKIDKKVLKRNGERFRAAYRIPRA
jgi:hypothetical protein